MKTRILKNNILFYISPILNILICIFTILILPFNLFNIDFHFNFNIFIYLILTSFNFYSIIYSGITSNNTYSLIGLMRGINQLISYEINIIIILLTILFLNFNFNFDYTINIEFHNPYFLFLLLFICYLAESNRTPFDLLEGESEIIAGYLIEYSGLDFTLIYLSEYGYLWINSYILYILFNISYLLILFFIIFIRALLPRYKYNKLLKITWIDILPLSFAFYIFYYIIN